MENDISVEEIDKFFDLINSKYLNKYKLEIDYESEYYCLYYPNEKIEISLSNPNMICSFKYDEIPFIIDYYCFDKIFIYFYDDIHEISINPTCLFEEYKKSNKIYEKLYSNSNHEIYNLNPKNIKISEFLYLIINVKNNHSKFIINRFENKRINKNKYFIKLTNFGLFLVKYLRIWLKYEINNIVK